MEQHNNGFFGLGIAPGLLEAIEKLGYKEPTPIQRKAIPIGVAGQDIIGIAQTGTGKTLAFAVPLIQHLAQVKGIGLILVPTRELALQVHTTLHKLAASQSMHTAVLIGGGIDASAARRAPQAPSHHRCHSRSAHRPPRASYRQA
jgi:superfamily II DNA/RNA helicase